MITHWEALSDQTVVKWINGDSSLNPSLERLRLGNTLAVLHNYHHYCYETKKKKGLQPIWFIPERIEKKKEMESDAIAV